MPGGVEIGRVTVSGACTLGFNTVANAGGVGGKQWFITASHCTDDPFGFDVDTKFTQDEHTNDDGRTIGPEAADASKWVCPSGDQFCTYADVAGIAYDDSAYDDSTEAHPDQGFIAHPDTFGTATVDHSIKFKITSNDSICPLDGYCGALAGDTLDKVGERTWWTRGEVIHTCIDKTSSGDGIKRVCSGSFASVADSGDSGAPVFVDLIKTTESGDDDVALRGVLWGGDEVMDDTLPYDSLIFFSKIAQIENELGDLCATEACVIPE